MKAKLQKPPDMHNVKTAVRNPSKSYRLRNSEKMNVDPFNTDRQSALHCAQIEEFS